MRISRIRRAWAGIWMLAIGVTVSGQKIPPQKPKLIVGITVSGMQYDYLSVYWDKFSDGGFRKMATTGANCKNARYNYLITDHRPVGRLCLHRHRYKTQRTRYCIGLLVPPCQQ